MLMSFYLIGLSGKMKAGKDTVADLIIKSHPDVNVKRMAFADALKQEIAAKFAVTVPQINADKKRWRLLMQWWGTEYRRTDDPDYWVMQLLKSMKALSPDVKMVVVTDVRFKNEADVITQLGGELWRINRTVGSAADAHASECELDGYDNFTLELTNNGSIDELKEKVNRHIRARFLSLR